MNLQTRCDFRGVAGFAVERYSDRSIRSRQGMSERRFVLLDFTHINSAGCLSLYEAGETYTMLRSVAHAAAKRGLVARERPADWSPPSILTLREVLTEADVLEAEAELRAVQRHALEVIDSEADN